MDLYGKIAASVVLVTVGVAYATCQQHNSTLTNNRNPKSQHLSSLLAQQPTIEDEPVTVYKPEGRDSVTLSGLMLKAFIRSNSIRVYHLDLHSYRQDAKYVGDPSFVDSENATHRQRCADDLVLYKNLLRSFNELDPVSIKNSLDSIRLADAFGRPESGALAGNQFWLGSYDQCLKLELSHPVSAETIKSQYCLGVAQFPNWNPQDGKHSFKIGFCLPETCTSSMLSSDSHLLQTVEAMMMYQIGDSTPYKRLKLREVYCLPHETSKIRQYSTSAMCFLSLVGSFVFACLLATIIDHLNAKLPENLKPTGTRTWRTIVIESFSITRNLDKFLHTKEDEPRQIATDNDEEVIFDKTTFLNSITGLKCVGLCWIICAHTFLVTPISSRNILDTDLLTKTYLADIYLTAHLMVDTFFALSGLLASYLLFKNGLDSINTSQWFVLTVHRYWRLTPIYLICYWFTKSVGFLTNSGPMWDYMTAEHSPRLNCARESWFEAFLHLSDFKSPKEHCVPFAWFIANGIKFWMITPIILILIHKSIRRGYTVTLGAILANITLVGFLAMRSNVDMKSVIEFRPESADNMLNNMEEVYTRPYSRIGTYLIGLLAGHLVYLVETNQLQIKLSKNTKIFIWTLFSITVIILMFVLKIANGIKLEEAVIPWVFSICSALIRPLWALCTCWFVLALGLGQVRWMARFLSANCWRVLVKLSFCAYLVQGEVIAQTYLSTSYAYAFTYLSLIINSIVVIVITLAVSLVMLLFLEYPLIGLEELILPKRRNSPPKPSCSVENPSLKLKST